MKKLIIALAALLLAAGCTAGTDKTDTAEQEKTAAQAGFNGQKLINDAGNIANSEKQHIADVGGN